MPDKIRPERVSHHLPPIPQPIRDQMERGKSFIYNVGPWEWRQNLGSLGMYVVPACPEGAKVSEPVEYHREPGIPSIVPQTEVSAFEGLTATYNWSFNTTGRAVARDVLGQGGFSGPSGDLTRYGVFLAAGEKPTEQEIEAAREKLADLYNERVREADDAYEVNGGMEMGADNRSRSIITKDHVQAAKALGLDRPWARKNVQMKPCEACGRPVSPAAVRCHHDGCGAVLDEAKARRLFPQLYASKPGPKAKAETVEAA